MTPIIVYALVFTALAHALGAVYVWNTEGARLLRCRALGHRWEHEDEWRDVCTRCWGKRRTAPAPPAPVSTFRRR